MRRSFCRWSGKCESGALALLDAALILKGRVRPQNGDWAGRAPHRVVAATNRAAKNALATAVMLHLRSRYVSKTAILGCWVGRSGQKSKSRLNSKDLDRSVSS